MNIKDVRASDKDKKLLKELSEPKTIAQAAVILESNYNMAYTKLAVLEAQGWVKKAKRGRTALYYLNQDAISLDQPEPTKVT